MNTSLIFYLVIHMSSSKGDHCIQGQKLRDSVFTSQCNEFTGLLIQVQSGGNDDAHGRAFAHGAKGCWVDPSMWIH